jgi:hypothetical protein
MTFFDQINNEFAESGESITYASLYCQESGIFHPLHKYLKILQLIALLESFNTLYAC